MHAAYLSAGIAVAALSSLAALWLADRAQAWGDRRVLHGFALVAPLICAALLGATIVKMLLIDCTRFSPLDKLLSGLQIGAILATVASSLVVHLNRYRRSARLQTQLGRLQPKAADPRAIEALDSALSRVRVPRTPALRLVDTERPIAFVLGVFRPAVVVSTGLLAILDDAELDATLVHELFHFKNGDNVFSACLGWLKDAFSFLPVARSAWARYEADRERTADALAARVTGEPDVLAEALVKVGEASLAGRPVASPRASVFAAAGVEERVEGIFELKAACPSRALTTLSAGAMLLLLLASGALSAPLFSENICMRVFCSL